jgi:hypothetical protein
MPTRRALCTACAPDYLECSLPLPTAHRPGSRAIHQCRSHQYSPSRSPGQQPKSQQGLQHHLPPQLPGPHFLRTCTVPATVRPFLRAHPRPASHALGQASALALTRLAHAPRGSGTALPGCTGGLHTWGRPRQYYPPLHSRVPGGGLAAARAAWVPSRANVFVPVQALSSLSRARGQEERRTAGVLADLAPPGWTIPWHGPSQAHPYGHAAFTSLAPQVCKVALSTHRLVSRTDRMVPCTSPTVGSARLRTAPLDGRAGLRRFLPPVVPEGLLQVRHCGFLHASCAIPTRTHRHSPSRRHRVRRTVPPVAHRCASSGVCGPHPGPGSSRAARRQAALTLVRRHGVTPQPHPCALRPASGRPRRLQGGRTRLPASLIRISMLLCCPDGHASPCCEAHDPLLA